MAITVVKEPKLTVECSECRTVLNYECSDVRTFRYNQCDVTYIVCIVCKSNCTVKGMRDSF